MVMRLQHAEEIDRDLCRMRRSSLHSRKLLPNLPKLFDGIRLKELAARATKMFLGYLKYFNLILAFPSKSKDGVFAVPDNNSEVV